MILALLTIVMMIAAGYAFLREGILTAITMCCNVFLAGLVTFNFFEPITDLIEPAFPEWSGGIPTVFWGYEDALVLMFIFCLVLGLLRLATNNLCHIEVEYHPYLQRTGAVIVGMITAYLICGFLVCVFQTLPWGEHFMKFEYQSEQRNGLLRVLPPDRVWLALMHRAGAAPFARDDGSPRPFDRKGTFELRYAGYRRYSDKGGPTYSGKDYGPEPSGNEYIRDEAREGR
jgi:hypothetical protein